jgi:hypothetical protein
VNSLNLENKKALKKKNNAIGKMIWRKIKSETHCELQLETNLTNPNP